MKINQILQKNTSLTLRCCNIWFFGEHLWSPKLWRVWVSTLLLGSPDQLLRPNYITIFYISSCWRLRPCAVSSRAMRLCAMRWMRKLFNILSIASSHMAGMCSISGSCKQLSKRRTSLSGRVMKHKLKLNGHGIAKPGFYNGSHHSMCFVNSFSLAVNIQRICQK